MNILFLSVGDETVASSRVRVYGYLPFLAEKGIGHKVLPFTSGAKCNRILNLKKDNLPQYIFELFHKVCVITRLLVLAEAHDIVFVQKVILPKIIWKILKMANRKIIFDFDDAIYIYKDITYLLKGAASVIISNKYLKKFAFEYNKEVHELISPVNMNKRLPPRKDDSITLGWVGSPEASKYLYPLIPVFKKLKERFENLNIEFMGAEKSSRFESSDINIIKWSLEGEKKYLEKIDIGIMPLADDEWTQSKAGYKLLLYMSMGIPCVAAPVGINKEIIKVGVTGFFASSEEEWLDRLTVFLENKKLRQEMGKNGWLRAKECFSYDAALPKFLNIAKLCVSPQMASPI